MSQIIEWLSKDDRMLCVFGPIFFVVYILLIVYSAYKDKK